MRVTPKLILDNVTNNININLSRISDLSQQLSSGKKVNRPSDDPVAAAHAMALKTAVSDNEQFLRNIDDAKGWLETADSVFQTATSSVQRIRELAVQAGDGTLTSTEYNSISNEMNSLINNLVDVLNADHAGRYIFAGTQTGKQPFSYDGTTVSYAGDSGAMQRNLAPSVNIQVNADGKSTFMDSGFFTNLIDLKNTISDAAISGDASAISGSIAKADSSLNTLLNVQASLGARLNRVNYISNRLQGEDTSLQSLLSNVDNIDYAKTITDYQSQQNVYQAALASSAKLMQTSLLDYLK